MCYPANCPRCPACGNYALAEHITCGRIGCDEGLQRKIAQEEWWYTPEGRAEPARIDAEIEAHRKETAEFDAEFDDFIKNPPF